MAPLGIGLGFSPTLLGGRAVPVDPPDDVVDTFTRADNATSLGTSDSGHEWIHTPGQFGISGNAAEVKVENVVVAYVDSGRSDATVEATSNNLGADPAGIVFRVTDATSYFSWRWNQSSERMNLFRLPGSNFLGASAIISTPTTIKAVFEGDSLRLYADDVLQFSTTDSTHLTATGHGLYADDSTGTKFDNFSVTAPE